MKAFYQQKKRNRQRNWGKKMPYGNEKPVQIPLCLMSLSGDLTIPDRAQGVVLFAHGSGSGRHSPRNRYVGKVLQEASLGTLLFDLLTEDEEIIDEQTRHLRFDIELLADRLIRATDWLLLQRFDAPNTDDIPSIGYFGASTGAAAALIAAAKRVDVVKAVVSRGGRPDLAGDEYLNYVRAPTLLLVGGNDEPVIELNQEAYDKLKLLKEEDEKRLTIVPGATHLFEEPGKLEQVAQLAGGWFACFLKYQTRRSRAEKSSAAK